MFEAIDLPFFQRALLAGLLASVACGVIGTFVVVKQMASISGGVAHAALGGVGLGYFLGFSPLLGAMGVGILSGLVIGQAYVRHYESMDTLIAMVWSFGMAIGILFLSMTPGYVPNLTGYLFGSIAFVPTSYLYMVAALDVIIIGVMYFLFNGFQAVAFDEEFAEVRGVNVHKLFLTLLVLIALAVVTLIKVVGIIMLIALLTIPAVIARQWSESLPRMMIYATLIAAFFMVSGLFLSDYLGAQYQLNLPCGPIIILISIFCFWISRLLSVIPIFKH